MTTKLIDSALHSDLAPMKGGTVHPVEFLRFEAGLYQ